MAPGIGDVGINLPGIYHHPAMNLAWRFIAGLTGMRLSAGDQNSEGEAFR